MYKKGGEAKNRLFVFVFLKNLRRICQKLIQMTTQEEQGRQGMG